MNNRFPPYQSYQNTNRTGNPKEHFKSLIYGSNNLQNLGASNISNSYANVNSVIQQPNYKNTGNIMHNNIKDETLKEIIQEYQLFIDSKDRNKDTFPNPFSFVLTFNPLGNRTETCWENGTSKVINGDPHPHISVDFKNVKYIRIDNLILPQYINYDKKELSVNNIKIVNNITNTIVDIENIYSEIVSDNNYASKDDIKTQDLHDYINTNYKTNHSIYDISTNYKYYLDINENKWFVYIHNTSDTLYNDKYIVLKIKELESNNLGTNHIIDDAFGIIYPDKIRSRFFYQGNIHFATKIWKDSNLGLLKRLTFEFYDSDGNLLNYNHIKQDITDKNDPRNPLHKHLQLHLAITIGVVEPIQNTMTQFSS